MPQFGDVLPAKDVVDGEEWDFRRATSTHLQLTIEYNIPHSEFRHEMVAFLRNTGVKAGLFCNPEYLCGH